MTRKLAERTGADATICATVRALRSAYGVDTAVLAQHMGVSRQSLYNRLNGAAPWLAHEVAAIAAYFGCKVQDLYDGTVSVRTAPAPSVSMVVSNPP